MSGIGDAVDALFLAVAVLLSISVPLAIWKIVDIAIWIYHHVSIGVK